MTVKSNCAACALKGKRYALAINHCNAGLMTGDSRVLQENLQRLITVCTEDEELEVPDFEIGSCSSIGDIDTTKSLYNLTFKMRPMIICITEHMQVDGLNDLMGKLYFRRGQAFGSEKLKRYDEAQEDFLISKQVSPANEAQCDKAISDIITKRNILSKQEAKRMKRAFGSSQP